MSKTKLKLIFFFIFIFSFAIYLSTSGPNTPYNYFTRLANAFLQGKYYLSENPPWLNELIPASNNRYFVVYPPMPAILSIPFVAIFGENFPQQYIAHLLGAGIVLMAAKISLCIKKDKSLAVWSALLMGFGSIIWFLSSVGSSWYLGQVSSAFFLMAAIYESLNKKRPLTIGLFLGGAYLSRLHTILSLPFFLYMLSKKIDLKKYTLVFLGLSPFFIFNAIYNFVRFGVIWDKGYALIPNLFNEEWYQNGLFNLTNVPKHLKVIFTQLPIFKKDPPFIQPSWAGLAIWITSPAFIYSIKSSIKELPVRLAWLSVILISLVIFSHGTTGFTQFGYRFAVDFYPFLMFLIIKGVAKSGLKWHHWLLLVIGIVVNLWGVLWINKFGWVSY